METGEELDDLGVPIRKKKAEPVEVDDLGVPIKKKSVGGAKSLPDYVEPIPEGGLGTPLKAPSKGSASAPPSTYQPPALPTAGTTSKVPTPIKATKVDILPYQQQAADLFKTNDLQGAISVLNDGISVAEGEQKAALLRQRANVWAELGKTKSKADFWIGKINGEEDFSATDQEFFNEREKQDKLEYGNITGDYGTISEKPLEVVAKGVNIGTIAENVAGELITAGSSIKHGAELMGLGKVTSSPSLIGKGAVKALAGAMQGAFGVVMNTTPEGILFQAGTAAAKEVVPGGELVEEILFAPFTWGLEPEEGWQQDAAAILDPIPTMALGMLAHKGSVKAAELKTKIENKEPFTAQDAVDYTQQMAKLFEDKSALEAIADQAGLKVKTEEQIKKENPGLEAEMQPEVKPIDKAVEQIKAGEPIKNTLVESNIPKEEFDARIEEAKFTGELTEQQIVDAKAEFARVEEIKATLPEQHKNNATVVELVEQKNALKKQKETIDEAFHPEINAKIEEITKRIQDETHVKIEKEAEPAAKVETAEVKVEAEPISPMKEEMVPEVELNPSSKKLEEAHPKEDIDFANEMIDEGWFNATGEVLSKRIDFDAFAEGGIQTSEVMKGIADIKKGKNTAPAKRLINFLNQVREKGEMPMMEGTGGQTYRLGVNLAEAKAQMVKVPKEITEAQAKEAEQVKVSEAIEKEGITKDNFDTFAKENDWLYTPEELKQIKTYLDESTRQAERDLPPSTPVEGEGTKLGEVEKAEATKQAEVNEVGDMVEHKGQSYKITKINPDGSIRIEPAVNPKPLDSKTVDSAEIKTVRTRKDIRIKQLENSIKDKTDNLNDAKTKDQKDFWSKAIEKDKAELESLKPVKEPAKSTEPVAEVKAEPTKKDIIDELRSRKGDNAIHSDIFQGGGKYHISIYDNKGPILDKSFKTAEEVAAFKDEWVKNNSEANKKKYDYNTFADVSDIGNPNFMASGKIPEIIKAKPVEPTKEERIQSARGKTASGLSKLADAIGAKKNIIGEERPKVIEALKEIAEGLSEEFGIHGEELYKKLKEVVGYQVEAKFLEDVKADIIGEPKLSGIKKGLVPEEVAAKVDVEKRTFQEVIDEGKRLVDSGEIDTTTLVSEIANGPGRALQASESAAMIYHKAKLDNALSSAYKEAADASIKGDAIAKTGAEARVAALEKQLEEYHVMQIKTAYEQGMSLAIRRAMLDSEYDLQAQIVKYKAANNGVIPAEVEAKFREYDKQLKEAQANLEAAETRAKNAEADLAIKDIKESVGREKSIRKQAVRRGRDLMAEGIDELAAALGVTKQAYGDVKPQITAALAKIGKGLIEVGEATAENLMEKIKEYVDEKFKGKIDFDAYVESVEKAYEKIKDTPMGEGKVKVPKGMIRDLVERGIDNIDELVAAVKEKIKKTYPEATDREVRDAITGYGKTVNQSKDVISAEVRKMKRVGRLLSSIEDAQNKMRPLRSGLQRDRLSKQELEMQKELKGLLKDLPFEESDMEFKQKSALDMMKKRVQGRIEDFERRISEKDFSPAPPKKVTRLDDEVIKAKAELEKVKEQYDLEHEKAKLSQKSTAEKFWDIGKDVVLSIPKSLQASMDMSAPLRQGVINTLRPSRIEYTAQELKTMVQHAFSEKKSEDWLRYIKASPEYALMKQSGLYIAEPNAKLSAREEIYKSNLVQRIPYLKHLFKGSERAYTGFLNMQRVNEFNRVAEKFKKDGIDPTTKEGAEVYKAWANFVNNATGRGSLGQFEMAANNLADVFFSPRLIAARFNTLNPRFYIDMPPKTRAEAMKSMAEFIGVGVTALALAKLNGADVETDPRSSNFGKIKIGNTTLDIWGGYVQWVRMIAQVATGERKSASTGKVTELGKGYGSDTRSDIVINFFKNKLGPTPALAVRMAESKFGEKKGETVITSQYGEETTIPEEVLGQVVPLYLQDIDKLAKEHDPATLAGLMLASGLGVGVQQYKPKKDPANKSGVIK